MIVASSPGAKHVRRLRDTMRSCHRRIIGPSGRRLGRLRVPWSNRTSFNFGHFGEQIQPLSAFRPPADTVLRNHGSRPHFGDDESPGALFFGCSFWVGGDAAEQVLLRMNEQIRFAENIDSVLDEVL